MHKVWKNKKLISLLLMFFIFISPTAISGQLDDENTALEMTAIKEENFIALESKVQDEGLVRVIVGLNVPYQLEGLMDDVAGIEQQREAIHATQESLIMELSDVLPPETVQHSFKYVPYVALTANEETLSQLRLSPLVFMITEDIPVPPTLAQSVPLIGADIAWSDGLTGQSQTVAILDTGVDKNHPFLQGKVVSEACYSTTFSSATTVCPNGQDEQIGSNAALPCSVNNSCNHGTHVAGIAAGGTFLDGTTSYSGVAKDASIIAIQVFSKFNNPSQCGGAAPCVLSYASDQIDGLERVYDLRNNFNISSVNLSLGGGYFSSPCDAEPHKAIIDQLRSVGIATVIAAGNDGFEDGLGSPGCISSAISVGATTKTDTIPSFSNSASFLDLLAPGQSIRSSIPGGTLGQMSGTSMATPHVTGAWAILKENDPQASVDEILSNLTSTGVSTLDSRNGLTFMRIQVDQAAVIPEFPVSLLVFLIALAPILFLFKRLPVMKNS